MRFAKLGDRVIVRNIRDNTPLVHSVFQAETASSVGYTHCGIRVCTDRTELEPNKPDLVTNKPLTCMWCAVVKVWGFE
jgi:hypothetical protein